MPLDPPTATTLNSVLQSLRTASTEIENVLGAAPQPAPQTRVEILQKNFEQLSHYDRHYSTTRSALTTLLVTVGLLVAREPLVTLWGQAACVAADPWAIFVYIVHNFAVTILLFLLAFPVNLHFRKLTLACNLIEQTIAREIGQIVGLPDLPPASRRIQRVAGAPIRGYYFSDDLRRVAASLGWPWFDAMTTLLLFAELEFLIIVTLVLTSRCAFWSDYFCLAILAPPVICLLAFLIARRR